MNKVKSLLEVLEAGKAKEPALSYKSGKTRDDNQGIEKTIKESEAELYLIGPYAGYVKSVDPNNKTTDNQKKADLYYITLEHNKTVMPYFFYHLCQNITHIGRSDSRELIFNINGTDINIYANDIYPQALWYRTRSPTIKLVDKDLDKFSDYLKNNFKISVKVLTPDASYDKLKKEMLTKQDAEVKRLQDPNLSKDDPALNNNKIDEFCSKINKHANSLNLTARGKYIISRKVFEVNLDANIGNNEWTHIAQFMIDLADVDKLDNYADKFIASIDTLVAVISEAKKDYKNTYDAKKNSGFYKDLK